MKKKLIISEEQYQMLTNLVNEQTQHERVVKKVVEDLEKNYKKAIETYRDGNEYKEKKVFEINVDGDIISPRDLLEYLKDKYDLGENFLKQLIEDWCDNKIKDNRLSKNISYKS